ncbi:hypothetical protein [Caballeronia catudaia]|uniref:hypothetical protein n=1 Tax=Caballeronia catudaia TaxID=1777136 RepID=UPI000772BC36|nr:hypothetical protein [Caballeronia catudaia]
MVEILDEKNDRSGDDTHFAACRCVLRMVKLITISEMSRKPLIDAFATAYQYVNLVLDAVLRADTIDQFQ